MPRTKLTVEDIRMIKYFWEDKGDPTRWVGFDAKLPLIRERCPEVLKAWDDYQTSIRTLTAVINNLDEDEYDSEDDD